MQNTYINDLIAFIKDNADWKEKLLDKPFSLKNIVDVPYHKDWYMFNYNLFESDLSNRVVKSCRGTILEISPDRSVVKVVCLPYYKFFNYADVNGDTINWSTAKTRLKCVSGDTIVHTENGDKPIKDVVNGDDMFVKSIDDTTGEVVMSEITNRWSQDTDQDWVEIETESGRKLKITTNDFLKMSNGAYREVCNLRVGDELVVQN